MQSLVSVGSLEGRALASYGVEILDNLISELMVCNLVYKIVVHNFSKFGWDYDNLPFTASGHGSGDTFLLFWLILNVEDC